MKVGRTWMPATGCAYRQLLTEALFKQALAVAREQDAKSLALRAATSLARLWCGHNRNAEAAGLLAPIYGEFSEGFDTTDLKEASALLVGLARPEI